MRSKTAELALLTPQSRPFSRFWLQISQVTKLLQRFLYGSFELGISAPHIILWRDIYLDIGICAVVFNAPAHIFEPEGIFWFSNNGSINQLVLTHISNDATPGAFTDQGTQAHEFKTVAEHITVRPGMLVRESDHRPARRLGGIGYGRGPAR